MMEQKMDQKMDEGLEKFKERCNWDQITKSLYRMPEGKAVRNGEDYLHFSDSLKEWLDDIGPDHERFPPDAYVFHVRQTPCEEDQLVLSNSDGSTVVVSVTHQPWYSTADQYLYYYFQLRKKVLGLEREQEYRRRNQLHIEKAIPVKKLPVCLENEIRVWQRNGSKKKSLQVDLEYLVAEGKDKRLYYDEYALGSALMLQYLCRDLDHRSDACSIQHSVEYGGVRYALEDYHGTLPGLKLEDYWLHEYYYGIGLSIEIAAVLIQIRKRFPKEVPWYDDLIKVALDLFSRRWLPTLVASRDFFTRNAMARLIFLDVLENADDFPRGTEDSLSEEAIHMVDCCVWRGMRRETPLEFRYLETKIPPGAEPEALVYTEALFARVKNRWMFWVM